MDDARKTRIMNINENFYIYLYRQNKKLIDEQRAKWRNHKNMLFDVAMTHIHTPP
jgi:hypothetical protein